MKKTIFYLSMIIVWFTIQPSIAQSLYNEDFNSYSVGPISNNNNGTLPGKGNWYAHYSGPDNAEIISEPGKVKVLKLPSYTSNLGSCFVFRNDLLSYWQQRQPGHNILKVSFDLYTGDAGNHIGGAHSNITRVDIMNKDNIYIIGYSFIASDNQHCIRVSYPASRNNPNIPPIAYAYLMPNDLKLPINQWVTLEFYVDYINNKLYFAVPSMGYIITRNSNIQLDLGYEGYDDSPNILMISNVGGYFTKEYFPKFDNINISAQNTTPTLSAHDYISKKHTIFPNPATDIVTISNNENIGIKQIRVFDISGKIIKSSFFNNDNEVQININDFDNGIYLLQINTQNGIFIEKLIKK